MLSQLFLEEVVRDQKLPYAEIDKNVDEILTSYSWPGNVRELKHFITKSITLAPDHRITKALVLKDGRFSTKAKSHSYDKTHRRAKKSIHPTQTSNN